MITPHLCIPAERRVEAPLVVCLWAYDAGEEDTSGTVTHMTRLHFGVVDQTLAAVPVPIWNAGQLGLCREGGGGKGKRGG